MRGLAGLPVLAFLVLSGCAPREDRDPEGEAAIRRLMEIHPAPPPPPRDPCRSCPTRPGG